MITLEQVNQTIGFKDKAIEYNYTERDACLYALGVGAPADWLDQNELKFVYELSDEGFEVLPSFPVIFTSGMIDTLISGKIGEIAFNPMMLVHGEQYLELKKPIPTSGVVHCQPQISQIYDKGSGMVLVSDVICRDRNGDEIAFLQSSMFIRGLGGYGGERGPSSKINLPPERDPDVTIEEQTLTKQALIYRLSGDINPLHADPAMAAVGGFNTPILHGLSTFGFAVRAILKAFCENNSSKFKSVHVRFSNPVFPGDRLRTEMWRISDTEIIFQTKVPERDAIVLSNAKATVNT